jgi:NAD+ synthase (glutamine-hydrolysing)
MTHLVPNPLKKFVGMYLLTFSALFHTCYMGTVNSGSETRSRARRLAASIGSYHLDLNIDGIITAILALFLLMTNKTPTFKINGGSNVENLALQNIQVIPT